MKKSKEARQEAGERTRLRSETNRALFNKEMLRSIALKMGVLSKRDPS